MSRLDHIQAAIDATSARSYLEIGVSRGRTFLQVRAPRKWAIDPAFRVRRASKWLARLKDPDNAHNQYFEMESEEFFQRHAEDLTEGSLDVAFIDGMHSYGAALHDVLATAPLLSSRGLILMHDCNPPTAASAQPADSPAAAAARNVPGWTGDWCGDVWKAVVHLRATRPDWTVFVLDDDWGIGVVDPSGPGSEVVCTTPEEIADWTFEDLERDRVHLLGLRPATTFESYLRTRVGSDGQRV